jgi:hypothetical protein
MPPRARPSSTISRARSPTATRRSSAMPATGASSRRRARATSRSIPRALPRTRASTVFTCCAPTASSTRSRLGGARLPPALARRGDLPHRQGDPRDAPDLPSGRWRDRRPPVLLVSRARPAQGARRAPRQSRPRSRVGRHRARSRSARGSDRRPGRQAFHPAHRSARMRWRRLQSDRRRASAACPSAPASHATTYVQGPAKTPSRQASAWCHAAVNFQNHRVRSEACRFSVFNFSQAQRIAQLRRPAQAVDRRANAGMDQPQSPLHRRSLRPPRHDPNYAATLDQANSFNMNPNFPDRLN